MSRGRSVFDRGYYERYYHDPVSAVTSRAEMRERAQVIAAFAAYLHLPVRRILDAGCGLGLLRGPLLRRLPRAHYVGLEASEYLCARFGWTQGQLEIWRTAQPFDLVVCYDVLQYLPDTAARRALANLGRLSRGLLYFSALTREDWQRNCDRTRTDSDVHLRPGAWYRSRLLRSFVQIGAGFWLRRGAPVSLWELEKSG